MNPILTAIVVPSIIAGVVGFLLTYALIRWYSTAVPVAWLLTAMFIIGGAIGVGVSARTTP